MADTIQSDIDITEEYAAEMKRQAEANTIDVLSISGETNLAFQANLQSICDQSVSVFAKYMETFLQNGEAIAQVGQNFAEVDEAYAQKMRQR